MTFFERWVWPAGGSGGIWGDVLGTFIWVLIAGVIGTLVWPPTRHAIEAFAHRHVADLKAHTTAHHDELHRKLDHIIEHSKGIPPLPPKDE